MSLVVRHGVNRSLNRVLSPVASYNREGRETLVPGGFGDLLRRDAQCNFAGETI